MGMAASQARYLALVARKSNCEYEGQQINQSRLTLSNQSADLFNQMMGLQVPSPPSKTDYTYKQYSFKDGATEYTIDKWNQLAEADSDGYNYVVTYHYNSNEFTGYQKYKIDPQVQFKSSVPSSSTSYPAQIAAIKAAQDSIDEAQKSYDDATTAYKTLLANAAKLTTFQDTLSCTNAHCSHQALDPNNYWEYKSSTSVTDPDVFYKNEIYYTRSGAGTSESPYIYTAIVDPKPNEYIAVTADDYNVVQQKKEDGYLVFSYTYENDQHQQVTERRYYKDGKYYSKTGDVYTEVPATEDKSKYVAVNDDPITYMNMQSTNPKLTDTLKTNLQSAYNALVEFGTIDSTKISLNDLYISPNGQIAFSSDLEELRTGAKSTLPLYYYNSKPEDITNATDIMDMSNQIASAKSLMELTKRVLDTAKNTYDALNVPLYVGNAELTSLNELDEDQVAAIVQIIKNMKDANIDTNLIKCFDTLDETYNTNTYTGGIYTFDNAGVTYYTTYYDLADSAANGTGINHIDDQPKLAYYGAETMGVPVTKTSRALLEADKSGRFTSIRFENDSIVHTLNAETQTDEVAYDDAMNQYVYERAIYDKKVQDINAKTSLIQQQDQQLELRLKQLDTEQNALNTEIDAVSKVVKDNIEKSFKTFGG